MQRNIFSELKYQWSTGQAHVKLVGINLIIFLLIFIIRQILPDYVDQIFTFSLNPEIAFKNPWGLFTSMFSHYDPMHIFGNMLFLYFGGMIFVQYFSNKRFYAVYLIGGIFGSLLELIMRNIFDAESVQNTTVLGASGSVMAIFLACAVHRPKEKIALYGIIEVPLFILALLYVMSDLFRLNSNDHVAHFAHIGGATVGILASIYIFSKNNIINIAIRLWDKIVSFKFKKIKPNVHMKAQPGGRPMTDADYNELRKSKQEKMNKILDKVSKSGYESLNKDEKAFLFSQKRD